MFRYVFLVVLAFIVQAISGYAPKNIQRVTTFRPANLVHGASPTYTTAPPFLVLRMSSEEEGSVASKISADGTFYDDEVDSAPVKQGISDSMRARLMAEANTGLDSNSKQTNVLLYIILGVAVLVVLGGAGVFY